MGVKSVIKFHTLATATATGEEYNIKFNYDNDLVMVVSIGGTATSRTLVFQAKDDNGNWVNVLGYNATDATSAITTTSIANEIWKLDLTGFAGFRVSITAIAGGNVSVTGKVVN